MALNLYNTLTKTIEAFTSLDGENVGMYTCGPTVYSYVTIGNWRTYALGDLLVRALGYNGFNVSYYMNITDVGHLTGDNEGDADTGIDRMEKAKTREGKNAWDIAKFYADDFKASYKQLNLMEPKRFLYATEHIQQQIALVQRLEQNGLTYKIDDGIYFDTVAYEEKGFTYGELSNLDQIRAGARVEFNEEKRDARDFALWKFSPKGEQRDMEWDSPWGVGFPGWHIECSAMAMQYLGEQFDIHVGGEDLKSTHHPNEIAQAQGATGKRPFVRFWSHGAFLQVDGGKMGKSLGNAYTLQDIQERGIEPGALRYFYFSGHYRSPLNFTWDGLEAAQKTLGRLKNLVAQGLSEDLDAATVDQTYKDRFIAAVNDDLNMPVALAVLHELLNDKNLSSQTRTGTALDFDRVLGLGLGDAITEEEIPTQIMLLAQEREEARSNKDWTRSDQLRALIENAGYTVKDTDTGPRVSIIK